MPKSYTAYLNINYHDDADEKTLALENMSLGEIGAHAEDIIKAETTATSFLISIVPDPDAK